MSRDVQVRDAQWPDIADMALLERAAFDDPWSEPTLWAEMAMRPRRRYVVAHRGADVVGHAGVDVAGDLADVMTVAVHPSARGQGLGSRLLDHLHLLAGAGGAQSVLLEVRADNEVARRLYASRDYHLLRTRPRYYPGGVDALVMRKELTWVHR